MTDHDEPEWLQYERRQEALRDKAENEPRPKNALQLWDEQFAPPELEDDPMTYEDGIRAAIAGVEKEQAFFLRSQKKAEANKQENLVCLLTLQLDVCGLILSRLRALLPEKEEGK